MFSLGIFEILTILIAALLILGPQKFPQIAKDLAQMIHKLRAVQSDIHQHTQTLKGSTEEIKDQVQKTIEKSVKDINFNSNSNKKNISDGEV